MPSGQPTTPTSLESALGDAIAEVNTREPWTEVAWGTPTTPEWIRADQAIAAVRDLVASQAEHLRESHPDATERTRSSVAAATLLGAWSHLVAISVPVTLTGSIVPSLALDETWIGIRGTTLTGIRFSRASHGSPDTFTDRVLDPEHGQPQLLVREMRAHLTPLHQQLCEGASPPLRRGVAARWYAVGDGIALTIGNQYQTLNPGASRLWRGSLASWFSDAFAPFGDPETLGLGPRMIPGFNGACCLWHRLPGEVACTNCPTRMGRTTDTEED